MHDRKKRLKKLCIDILLEALGLIALFFLLTYAQTRFSAESQAANSNVKLEVAIQRTELHKKEADANLYRYDRFSQATVDTLAYFYEHNMDQTAKISGMANQWQLQELYILNSEQNIIASNTGSAALFKISQLKKLPEFEALISQGSPFTIDHSRYYASSLLNGTCIIMSKDCTDLLNSQAEILSPANALQTISVAQDGYVMAIDIPTGKIMYHPDSTLCGQAYTEVGLSSAILEDDFHGTVKLRDIPYHCITKNSNDQIAYIAFVPEAEITSSNFMMVMIALMVFAFVISLIVAYIHFIRMEQDNPFFIEYSNMEYLHLFKDYYFNKTIWHKVKQILLIGLFLIFIISFYMQSLAALSAQSIRSDQKLKHIENIFAENQKKLDDLTIEYKEEYGRRTQNIAYLLKEDPSLVDNNKLKALAKRAQVDSIYVFDANGNTVATNTVFKDFSLSKNSKDASYEFWNIINGYEDVIVQDAVTDETIAQNYVQFTGTARLDELGLVQLGISPKSLSERLKTLQLNYILQNTAVENQGFLFAIDDTEKTFVYYPNKQSLGDAASEHGLTTNAYEGGYRGYQTIDKLKYFVNSMFYENEIIYVAFPVTVVTKGRLVMALLTTLASAFALLLISSLSTLCRLETPPTELDPTTRASLQRQFLVQSAVSRWDHPKGIPWKEKNAEQRIQRIISVLLSMIGIGIVLFSYIEKNVYDQSSIFSYILHKKWAKGPNIFSFSYILLTIAEVMVLAKLLAKAITLLTTNLGSRAETIGRLFNNFIKYTAVIGTIFYCLNFLGVQAATLLASAGILTLVIGLGAQSLIGDILAGIFIVFEGEFRVGDIVTIGDFRGTVLEIGIRSTKIEDAFQNIKVFNNSSITGVVNMTQKYSYAFCDVGIEYGESLEKVEALLKKEFPVIRQKLPEIAEGPYYKGVISLGDSSVIIRILVQCLESDRVQLTRDLNREILLLFNKHHITIPFPQIVINTPAEHVKATRTEIKHATEFNQEQKEASKSIHADDT